MLGQFQVTQIRWELRTNKLAVHKEVNVNEFLFVIVVAKYAWFFF